MKAVARFFFLTLSCIPLVLFAQEDPLYRVRNGNIQFRSDAPLELIEAESEELGGIILLKDRTFALSVLVLTFEGFNSPLQREHFHENYMESKTYPTASFKGKIIEPVDFGTIGEFDVRAKGILKVHGVEQERIIKCRLSIREDGLFVRSSFLVPLADHDITIPKIVNQKIAEEIAVEVEAEFGLRE
jgi:hypothetical protein